jgi:hypothetical protein
MIAITLRTKTNDPLVSKIRNSRDTQLHFLYCKLDSALENIFIRHQQLERERECSIQLALIFLIFNRRIPFATIGKRLRMLRR